MATPKKKGLPPPALMIIYITCRCLFAFLAVLLSVCLTSLLAYLLAVVLSVSFSRLLSYRLIIAPNKPFNTLISVYIRSIDIVLIITIITRYNANK